MADEELRRIFAKNLRYFLELNHFSQADLARHMKVSTATAAKWCTGQSIPRVDRLQSLCNWLGCEKSDLLEEKDRSEEDHYYLDRRARELINFLKESPEHWVLFDAARKIPPDDVEFMLRLMEKMNRNE